jgi:hypothetical protein
MDGHIGPNGEEIRDAGMGHLQTQPIDGDYEAQTPEGGLEVYAFDWEEGIQHWWTCEYDAFEGRMPEKGSGLWTKKATKRR